MSATPIPFPQDKNGAHAPFEAPSGPWWKYAHMWMVVGGPLIVVVASFVTLWMAIRTPDPVYTDADVGRVPSAATIFDDVYKEMPEHLRRQRQQMGV